METIKINSSNFKEYTEEELMVHCGLTDADFEEEHNIEVTSKVFDRNERIVERIRNGIITDTCLISIEDSYDDKTPFMVVTWYDVNEPYAYRTKEENMEFKTVLEARKEMRNRVLTWEKRFESL